MKSLKAECSNIHCPSCGAAKVVLTDGDVFRCEYCDTKFNFDLDDIEPSTENKIMLEELKGLFSEKKALLEGEKQKYKNLLVYYSVKSSAKKSEILSVVCLLISVAFLFSVGISPFLALGAVPGIAVFIVILLYRKKVYKKYHPFAQYFASKVVKYEEQISVYTKLLSKLTE